MLGRIQPHTVLVSLVTALVAWKGARRLPQAAIPVVAIGAGTALYHALEFLMPGVGLGQQLPQIEATLPRPVYLTRIFSGLGEAATLGVLGTVIAGAVTLAILDSVASLIIRSSRTRAWPTDASMRTSSWWGRASEARFRPCSVG
jgi:hypothetical protein